MEPRMVSESDMRSAQTVHCACSCEGSCDATSPLSYIDTSPSDVLAIGPLQGGPGSRSGVAMESRLPKMLRSTSSSSGLGVSANGLWLALFWHMARVQVARRTSRASTADRLWPVEPYGSWFGGAEGRFRRLPLARRTPSAHPIAKRWRTATNSLANILNTQTFSRRDRPASSELRCSRRPGRKPTGHACRIAYDCST